MAKAAASLSNEGEANEAKRTSCVLHVKSIKFHFHFRSPESAARGVIDAYKLGESGSTWLLNADKPAADITHAVTKAYQIMGEGIVQ